MEHLIIFGGKYLFLVVILFAFVFFLKQTKTERKKIVLLGLLALPISYLVAKISSMFFYNPRPFAVDNFAPLISHIADNGFPSDHTLLTASIAFLVFVFDKRVGSVLLFLSFLVGLSRVLAGVHHPVDIVGSIVIAGVVVWLVVDMKKRILNTQKKLKN